MWLRVGGTGEWQKKLERAVCAQSHPTLCDPMNYSPAGSPSPWDFPGKNTGVGCQALLQGIFPTQGLNPGLLNCRQILYHLSHWRSPTEAEEAFKYLREYYIWLYINKFEILDRCPYVILGKCWCFTKIDPRKSKRPENSNKDLKN